MSLSSSPIDIGDAFKLKPLTEEENLKIVKRLAAFRQHLEERTQHHLGYPYNLEFDFEPLKPFLKYAINNLNDPFKTTNYDVHSKEFELDVLKFFAEMWRIDEGHYWGYVTSSGTEGNLLGLLFAREKFPEATIFYSAETHYSVPKAGRLYRIPLVCVKCQPSGEMDYTDLRSKLAEYGNKPVIINVNIGTTVKGAVDSLAEVQLALAEAGHNQHDTYIHADGALGGLLLPFTAGGAVERYQVSFPLGLDSISVSGHKMVGCPMPCGIVMCKKEHQVKWRKAMSTLHSTDTTLLGSRSGLAPIAMWLALQRKRGCEGLRNGAAICINNAKYLIQELSKHGIPCFLNPMSCTVVLSRPPQPLVLRWQLACTGGIAHVVVMPSSSLSILDKFVGEIVAAGAPTSPINADIGGADIEMLHKQAAVHERMLSWHSSATAVEVQSTTERVELTGNETRELWKRLLTYEERLKERTQHHLGAPFNLEFDSEPLEPFLKYSVNNLGDPFVVSNYGVHAREYELEVVQFFARLWEIDEGAYWGYVTNCGAEGNMLGLLYARERFPDATVFCSEATHYSVRKSAMIFQMKIVDVKSQPGGEIDYADLRDNLTEYGDKPIIMVVNVGTTALGAVDSLGKIKAVLTDTGHTDEDTYIHVDGDLAGYCIPFTKGKEDEKYMASFARGADSMSVSGHKMLGCPLPCGVVVTKREHMERWGTKIEYLNSTDTTIMGSRNGQASMALWLSLQRKRDRSGLIELAGFCVKKAEYLANELGKLGVATYMNNMSSTVTFQRPPPVIERKWQLSIGAGNRAHLTVMPSTSFRKLDKFIRELGEVACEWGNKELPIFP